MSLDMVRPFLSLYFAFCLFFSLHFSRQASQGYKGGISNVPNVGMYCCAKSPLDQTWYRAHIKAVKTVEVTEERGNGIKSIRIPRNETVKQKKRNSSKSHSKGINIKFIEIKL